MFKSILALLLIAIICSTTSVTAQVCKNKVVAFDPAPCPTCTTCTGVSPSCCDSVYDSTVNLAVSILELARVPSSCITYTKMFSCAVCDPNNQKYYTNGAMPVCRSMCQKMKDACGTFAGSFADCSSNPETNCWNSAPLTNKMNWIMFVMAAMSLFFMF